MYTQGIILTSFGSIYGEAVNKSLGTMAKRIEFAYPEALIRKVFLSDALLEKWNEKYEDKVLSLLDAIKEMEAQGITEIYIQPFTLVADQCYQQLRKDVNKYLSQVEERKVNIYIARPMLASLGVKNYVDDYEETLQAIRKHVYLQAKDKSILLMANGQNQLEYSTLQLKALYSEKNNIALFTSNGFPNFKQSLSMLDNMNHQEVLIVPLALIGSVHLMDYLGGNRPDSISMLLTEAGYNVYLFKEGLGENPYIQELFLRHLKQTILLGRKRLNHKREQSIMFTNKNETVIHSVSIS